MRNLMGSGLMLHRNTVTASLGYDEIAHAILQTVDSAAREFCNTVTVSELFKDADIRLKLENHVAQALSRNLGAVGMRFVRLKEADFESEVFEKLRSMSGDIESKRREIEFMRRADELANDATRREALSEHEMEEYVTQLAHEKDIKDDLRNQELERLRLKWAQEKDRMKHEADMATQLRQAESDEELHDLHHREELARRIEAQKSSVEYMQLETQIQEIRLEIEKKKTLAEQEATAGWMKLKEEKKVFDQRQKIEMINAAKGADMRALLMAEEDSEKREQLLRLNEQEMQLRMTPELLLAAAAARGNPAAAEALSRMNRDQLEAIESSKRENRETYERLLQMNERMFTSSLESLSKSNSSPGPTTQIIK